MPAHEQDAARALSDAQIEQFIQDGFVKVERAFPRALADEGRAMLLLFSDVGENDAPTRIKIGSHRDIARFLEPAGEAGLSHAMLDQLGAALQRPEALATGEAGDVYLCHPFLVHAAQMHRGASPRFMAQPPLHPSVPFQLERADGGYCPVEIAIRRAMWE